MYRPPSARPTPACTPAIGAQACYRVLQTRDARFDGHFFTGVRSTGIYCRPVCKVRIPKESNCTFFVLAAQAEAAGYRPCLRCRPELAPSTPTTGAWSLQDASATLAQQALALVGGTPPGGQRHWTVDAWAQRLGVSARHLRRILEQHLHIGPLQYLQTHRLLQAKQWLSDTQAPMAQVAEHSGFGSVRRFNAVFMKHYRLTPGAMRRQLVKPQTGPGAPPSPWAAGWSVDLPYRPPLDADHMLQFFAHRAIAGIETVDLAHRQYARTVTVHAAGQAHIGWMCAQFLKDHPAVQLTMSASLAPAFLQVQALCRQLFDLNADPLAFEPLLSSAFPGSVGLRVAGTVNGFELGVRAILGQQITVQAARTLGTRVAQAFGQRLPEAPHSALPTLDLCFPEAQRMAQLSGPELGALGIVRQRQAAIIGLAQAVAQGQLVLEPGAPLAPTLAALQAIAGIGPWTAQYIAMRALQWPDAFPAGDVALHKALGLLKHPQARALAHEASLAWQPWRSYATIRAWSQLAAKPAPSNTPTPKVSP